MAEYSERFDDALRYAREKHRGHLRKGSEVPYIGHLLGVASTVIDDGGTEDEAVAALLHDVAEDQGGEKALDEIERKFGRRVREIVRELSDSVEESKEPWRPRKEAYLEELPHKSREAKRISLADKLYNARAIVLDHARVGDEIWDRFAGGEEGTKWYYRELLKVFRQEFDADSSTKVLVDEFGDVVDVLVAL